MDTKKRMGRPGREATTELGRRILRKMKARGINRETLALALGVSRSAISRIVHREELGTAEIRTLARVLGCKAEYLMPEGKR